MFDSPETLSRLAVDLAASGHWSVGIGVGAVDQPLPTQTRAGRGPAFLAARDAVEAAKRNRWHLCVAGPSSWCPHAQSAGRLLVDVLADRSDAGREAVALVSGGRSQAAAARHVGITPQAMSLRLQHARWDVEPGARALFSRLLDAADRSV
ncbi:hypothetical protein [Gordonia sp. (in: high G+C Gram-positive bacteria)]|uniref:hypothetical protein n=1 Tax=Gordonia TaxID=2053 RepID=UPI003C7182CE